MGRLRRRLLSWFRANARDLPWRHTRDPYAIWVSEIMLQQTQVATVIPYFLRFLQTFPTLADLAAADEQQVLRLWEGLGYYRRARALHQAARLMVERHGGQVPADPEILGDLPGFGRYTVGAVLSQALDQRLPILEANSQRVLCRLLAVREDPRQAAVRKRLWSAAEGMLPQRGVGEFNQALMELGALVCKPTAPGCDECPVRQDCLACQQGRQEEIPLPASRPKVEDVQEVVLVIRRNKQVVLAQRPDQGRWGGMWEFPQSPLMASESHEEAARRLLAALNLRAELSAELGRLRHGITRFRLHLRCLEARRVSGRLHAGPWQRCVWTDLADVDSYPLSVPQRKLAGLLKNL